MKRQTFLKRSAAAMIVAALPPLSQRVLAEDTVDYALTSAPLTWNPTPGLDFPGIAYNGVIPGPLLRVRAGQRLRVNYVNNANKVATIHWHGFVLPNRMDGVEYVTQQPVPQGKSFHYDFVANPPGTRWYHDHVEGGLSRGLFGMIIVDDPKDERADAEFALVFHDVPNLASIKAAMMGVSKAPMADPIGSPEMLEMKPDDKMGDEISYAAHCINGQSYPATQKLAVKVGQRVRLRVLNANLSQTRYVRLAGHRLTVTHGDGNPLGKPLEVDALRIGVGERYDAWFEVKEPGAWLLQGISSDPLAYQQAAVVYTPGMEGAAPASSPQTLEGVDYFTYEKACGIAGAGPLPAASQRVNFTLGGGEYGSNRWTIDGKTYPNTPRIYVRRDELIEVHFKNTTDMEHPMHLHGHTFDLVAVDGKRLARPLAKDTTLVRPYTGTITWRVAATSPAGRWLLHCHNAIHMMDGMMTELVYR